VTTLEQQVTPKEPTEAAERRQLLDRLLGHPIAFIVTVVLLLTLFGWTFVTNPDRVAPTKDPAYYTWRTEMLISDDPSTLLETEGAFDMFAGGYRVAAPVIGGFLRHIPGVSTLNVTVLLMVALPVLTALCLASFAYRHRPDPLVWHAVALGSASLFLTPPFVGYLDNMLCLFFLAAALPFLTPLRRSWPARIAFGLFLLCAGLTHPTTLAIFCLTLGAMAAVRLLVRRFDVRSVIRDDGPMLLVAFASAVLTYLIWKVGIWGKSASLTEAALPPPYGSDFFVDRLLLWVKAMRPALNGPLFVIGAAGLLAAGKRAAEDELGRVSIVWLAPLAGIFGFLAGLTYPYYRFFNTTLAWVLLVGVGIYFAARLLLNVASRGGTNVLALAGVVALATVIATNFLSGFDVSGWNNPDGGWLSEDERRNMDVLRGELQSEEEDRPVVFVIDDEPEQPFQIWGFTKLSGNTSRYGLPAGQIDRGYLYLGSLENFLQGLPTTREEETYDKLSPALLEDAQKGIEQSGGEPIVVVVDSFNKTGANADIATGDEPVPQADEDIMVIREGSVIGGSTSIEFLRSPSDAGHLIRAITGMILLMLPGILSLRFFLRDARLADAVGLAPALAVAQLSVAGIVILALVRSSFSSGAAWLSLLLALAVGLAWAFERWRLGRASVDAR
jgi:hypothetical protein